VLAELLLTELVRIAHAFTSVGRGGEIVVFVPSRGRKFLSHPRPLLLLRLR
jgi:hypothetical protein